MARKDGSDRAAVKLPYDELTITRIEQLDPNDRKIIESHDPGHSDGDHDPYVAFSILRRGRIECETPIGGELQLDVELGEENFYIVRAARVVAPQGQAVHQSSLMNSELREIIYWAATEDNWVQTEVHTGGLLDAERLPSPSDLATIRAMHDLAVYFAGYVVRGNPTKALEEAFDISRAAAAQRVARLRERRLLGPAEQGRASL